MEKKTITIVGMGPLISFSVAVKFAEEGYRVAMIARNEEKLKDYKSRLNERDFEAEYFTADAASEVSLRKAFANIHEKMGKTDVLFYNAANLQKRNLLEENFDKLVEDFKVNVAGAFAAFKAVYPFMRDENEGSFLITGGGLSIDPDPEYGSLSIGKAGIRNLAQNLSKALVNTNIFVGTIIIRGYVKPEKKKYNPADIAALFYKMHHEKKVSEIEY